MTPDLLVVGIGAAVLWGAATLLHGRSRSESPSLPADLKASEIEGFGARADGDWHPVAGTNGELSIRVRSESRIALSEGEVPLTIIEVSGLARTLTLRAEDSSPPDPTRANRASLEVGDPAFDHALFVVGPEAHLRAVLDEETRALVRRVFQGRVGRGRTPAASVIASGVRLEGGLLQARLNRATELSLRHDAPGDTARALVDVALALRHPEGALVAKLAQNARRDPCAGVRLGALQLLLRDDADHPETVAARRAALADADARVRLKAAEASGEDGKATLLELAMDTAVHDPIGSAAVALLQGRLPGERWVEILERAVATQRWATAAAAVAAVGAARAKSALPTLLRLVREGHTLAAPEAAAALSAIGGPEAEPALLEALPSDLTDLRAACARALGAVGSAASVPALRDREASDPDRRVRRAAREAVAAIQSRLEGASPGQVALAEDADGRVSLSEDERGRVSAAGTQALEEEAKP